MLTPDDIHHFKTAVDHAKTIFISAHVGPDGDTLGSMLGLRHAFLQFFPHIQRTDCVITGRMPESYQFMPGIDTVKDMEKQPDLLTQYDLAFSVDCGSADRLGPAKPYFVGAHQSINIDHHISNDRFGSMNIIVADAAASGEIVADLLTGNGFVLSKDIATCLYVALLTDTGGFKYTNTTAKVFELAASLVRCGANPEQIYRHIYEEVPKAQTLMQAEALRQAKFNADETLCWTRITQDFLSQFGARDEHAEGLVECLRRIDTVLISAMLKETRLGHTKISLRSDTPHINVADIMARWNGGGHKMAAGCTMEVPPEEAESLLLPVLQHAIDIARPQLLLSTRQ